MRNFKVYNSNAVSNAAALLVTAAAWTLATGELRAQSLTSTVYASNASPIGVTLGDFNRDGKCDSATINQGTPSFLNLMLGDGAGGILSPTTFTCGFPGGAGIVAGDWNGDTLLDVATVELNTPGPTGQVTVFLGNGLGSFQPAVSYAVGIQSRSVASADFNGDGILDVVTANSSTAANSVTVLLGDGLGGFIFLNETAAGSKPWAIVAGDLTGDGIPDAATANNGGNSLSVLANNGTGMFPAGAVVYPTNTGTRAIAMGDLNSDGKFDLVTANGVGNDVTVYFSNGAGVMSLVGNFAVGTNPSSVTIGDVDGDGYSDICATDQTGAVSNVETVLLGTGGPAFPVANNFTTGNFPAASRISDLNTDGRPDIVVCNYGGSSMTVLLNGGTLPSGLASYGVGTQGCFGELGLTATSSPAIGNSSFRFNSTNAPKSSFGMILVTDSVDSVGSDPFGIGAKFHVDVFAATEIIGLDAYSDASGTATCSTAIPRNANIIGLTYYAQGVFVESPGEHGSVSPYGVVTSHALALTIF